MGLITWVIIAIVILAIIGLGWQAFFSGLLKGAEKVGQSNIIKNGTQDLKELAENGSEKVTQGLKN